MLPRDQILRDIGKWAETVIGQDYLVKEVKRPGFFPDLPGAIDFHDSNIGSSSKDNYVNFLKARNPGVDRVKLDRLANTRAIKGPDGQLMYIPDILTHDDPRRLEFYEIKPNSKPGARAGEEKVASVDAFAHDLGLPYSPGTIWKPDERIEIWKGVMFGVEAKVEFHYFRDWRIAGLIVYEFCIQIEGDRVRLIVMMMIIALVIVMILAAPVPKPIPVPA